MGQGDVAATSEPNAALLSQMGGQITWRMKTAVKAEKMSQTVNVPRWSAARRASDSSVSSDVGLSISKC